MPEVEATLGIVFAHGTAMPHLPVGRLVDSAVAVEASARRVAMAGEAWELPTFESAEDFVGKLARAGPVGDAEPARLTCRYRPTR